MLHAYFSLIFERISVKLGWYIGSISSINPMTFQVSTPNVMVTVRQNNSSIPYILLFIATISQDLFNPCPWMFRPRIRLMGHHGTQFKAKADLPVGFPYRFNSSLFFSSVGNKGKEVLLTYDSLSVPNFSRMRGMHWPRHERIEAIFFSNHTRMNMRHTRMNMQNLTRDYQQFLPGATVA